jgi:hypothetical protein
MAILTVIDKNSRILSRIRSRIRILVRSMPKCHGSVTLDTCVYKSPFSKCLCVNVSNQILNTTVQWLSVGPSSRWFQAVIGPSCHLFPAVTGIISPEESAYHHVKTAI